MKLRKTVFATIALTVFAFAPSPAAAQHTVGSWETVTSYGGTPSRLIDTPGKVYVLSQNRLSSFDKELGEVFAYSRDNLLNDGKIADIFYNFDKKFLMVSYLNDNIDILFEDGRTLNFPELMNATLTEGKTINDVAFDGDRIYVGAQFGLMVLNVDKGIVEETGLYGFPVVSVTTTPSRLFIGVRNPGKSTWYAPKDISHTRFSQFTKCWADCALSMEGLSDSQILGAGVHAGIINFDPSKESIKWTELKKDVNNTRIQRTRSGYMIHDKASGFMLLISPEGEVEADLTLPAEAAGNALGVWTADPKSVWVANETGYGRFDVAADAFTIQRMHPNGTSGPNVGRIAADSDGVVYVMTMGDANENSMAYRDNIFIDRIDPDGRIEEISPLPAMNYGYKFDVNPSAPDIIALATRRGICRLDATDRTYTVFDGDNSPVTSGITPMMTATRFDSKGNAWFLMHWDEDGADNLYCIPAAAWKKGPEGSDIVAMDFGTEKTCHSSSILTHSSGLVLFSGVFFVGAYDPGSSLTNTKDDKYVVCSQTVDADGMTLDGRYIFDMEEDFNGQVWLATLSGVRVIRDPKKMFETGWTINRPKVPRNDGTNLADFLLDGETVTDVSVDANNNKWFSTAGSGIYRSNPEGTEILDHFTTDNSGLISNVAYAIHADRNSNRVYVATDEGLCVYNSTTAPAAADYSDVYAYPNPVTPDYTGLITVTGLMDKSLVKIADAAGNVFHQSLSEGGMITWDGCDASGARVKSGVYYVFASQNSDGGSSAVVTKILVIN